MEVMKKVPPSHYLRGEPTTTNNAASSASAAAGIPSTASSSAAATYFQLAMEHVHHVSSKLLQLNDKTSPSCTTTTTTTNNNNSNEDYSNFIIQGGCPFKAYHRRHHQNQNADHDQSASSSSSSSLSSSRQLHLSMVQAMEDFSVSAIMGRMAVENNNFDKIVSEQKSRMEEQRETVVLDDVHRADVDRDSKKKVDETKENRNDDVGQEMSTVHDKVVAPSEGEPPKSLLSQALKTGTAKSHSAAENVHFVHNFINGIIDRELYKDMITGLFHIYITLEKLLEEYAPTYFPSLHFPQELNRVDSLREDMEYWHGYDWERQCNTPSPAVQDYIDRMKEVGRLDPLLLLSHAYTRYLGDLSGGKVLSRIARRALHLGKKNNGDNTNDYDGLQFYNFDSIPSAKLFKDLYRTKLDQLSLSSREINKLVAEANVAFALNMRVFEELDVKGGVIGARVRNVREALSYYDIERKGDDGEALPEEEGGEEDGEAKCPFGFGSGPNPHQLGSVVETKKLAKESLHKNNGDASRHASSHAGAEGRCPWPFIFFHDPTTGLKDWQTWFVIGIALCYAWSHVSGV